MGLSERAHLSRGPARLTKADLPGLLALSEEAGWSQTEADWRVFLREGRVHGLRDALGRLIASAASLPYEGYGYVSMVLVTSSARRQGHATQLMRRAVADLKARDLIPVLDATPEGALVYAREGFVPVFGFARYRRAGGAGAPSPAFSGDPAHVIALDAKACGTPRAALISDFAARPDTRIVEWASGFALARAGRRETQIGPLVAAKPAEAAALFDTLLGGISGPCFIDVPDHAQAFISHLSAQGFVASRRFTRMTLGGQLVFGQPALKFALAGPEFG